MSNIIAAQLPQTTEDVRRGLPSASGIERIILCPGSREMEVGLPETKRNITEEGTLLHSVLAGESSYDDLTFDQQAVIDRVREIEAQIVRETFGDKPVDVIRGRRQWYPSGTTPALFSGETDVIYRAQDRSISLIIDYKMGYIPVTNIAQNPQLGSYALLEGSDFGPDEIRVAVIQPRCANPREIARYTMPADVQRLDLEIRNIIQTSEVPNAPRFAGEKQCKYCRAKGICPEARKAAYEIAEIRPLDLEKRLANMPGTELSTLLDLRKQAKEVIEAIEIEAKNRLNENINAIPGYGLKPGNQIRSIINPVASYKAMEAAGVTAAEFMAACDVKVTKLEEVFGLVKKLKGASVKKEFNATMSDLITLKQNAPSLVKVAA